MTEPAWITTIDEQEADAESMQPGELATAYAECAESATGRAANIMRVHSLYPRSMLAHRALYRTLMFGPSPLERYEREMIAVVVSAINGCGY